MPKNGRNFTSASRSARFLVTLSLVPAEGLGGIIKRHGFRALGEGMQAVKHGVESSEGKEPVSYTHLTLPTTERV